MSTSDLVQTQRLKRNKSWCAPPYRLETKPGATRGPAGGICGGHHVCSEYWFLWPVSLGAIFEWQESRSGGSGRNTLRVSRFRLPLAIPCPILRCAEISQQRSGSALVSCTGERPSRRRRGRGRGGGWGERGEVGSVLHLSFCRVQHVQLACLNVAGNSSLGFKMAHCPQNVEILKCRMSKMPPVRVEFKSRESQDKRKDRDLSQGRSRASRCGVTPTVIGPAIAWVPQMIYFERLIRRRLLGGAPLTSSSSSTSSLFPQASA